MALNPPAFLSLPVGSPAPGWFPHPGHSRHPIARSLVVCHLPQQTTQQGSPSALFAMTMGFTKCPGSALPERKGMALTDQERAVL